MISYQSLMDDALKDYKKKKLKSISKSRNYLDKIDMFSQFRKLDKVVQLHQSNQIIPKLEIQKHINFKNLQESRRLLNQQRFNKRKIFKEKKDKKTTHDLKKFHGAYILKKSQPKCQNKQRSKQNEKPVVLRTSKYNEKSICICEVKKQNLICPELEEMGIDDVSRSKSVNNKIYGGVNKKEQKYQNLKCTFIVRIENEKQRVLDEKLQQKQEKTKRNTLSFAKFLLKKPKIQQVTNDLTRKKKKKKRRKKKPLTYAENLSHKNKNMTPWNYQVNINHNALQPLKGAFFNKTVTKGSPYYYEQQMQRATKSRQMKTRNVKSRNGKRRAKNTSQKHNYQNYQYSGQKSQKVINQGRSFKKVQKNSIMRQTTQGVRKQKPISFSKNSTSTSSFVPQNIMALLEQVRPKPRSILLVQPNSSRQQNEKNQLPQIGQRTVEDIQKEIDEIKNNINTKYNIPISEQKQFEQYQKMAKIRNSFGSKKFQTKQKSTFQRTYK